ncbi:hypothetical protein MTBBW1_2250008 [Desulfamplus magnetovallimortis]|uniref:Uncharacterized protein n=1 Tax=Desulfamplus magnetovallimortis TaxID=1246637 RepID=A0A1W1HDF8_9BACT|nr:hypothetical protein MTBBW1_2250008 [Desulfamplus magnetovallimortis]
MLKIVPRDKIEGAKEESKKGHVSFPDLHFLGKQAHLSGFSIKKV